MVKSLYTTNKANSYYSFYQYNLILKFLYAIETFAPEVINDLQLILDIYKKDSKTLDLVIPEIHDFRTTNRYEYPKLEDFWKTFKKNISNINSKKVKQQDIEKIKKFEYALETWRDKYNLNNENGFYEGLALIAIVITAKYMLNDSLYYENGFFYEKKTDELIYMLPMAGRIDIPEIEDAPVEIKEKRKDKNYISLSLFLDIDSDLIRNVKKDKTKPYFIFAFTPFCPYNPYKLHFGNHEDNLDYENAEEFEMLLFNDYAKASILNYADKDYCALNLDKKYIKNKELKKNISKFSKLSIADVEALPWDEKFELMPWHETSNLYWDPTLETWEDFNKKIDALFNRYKELYKKRTEEFLRQNNFVKGKEKRKDEHFKWLVLYQVKYNEPEQITQMITNEDPKGNIVIGLDAVKDALKNTAEIVGLNPRGKLLKNVRIR
ncbi:hypothetical protein [Thermoanaerobacterium sp. RBIITD]|uniref:hypothetical protein n=1 Tax=Thermoanaerobacterium sp. RBIITD TaxID=1550240 RepID=UPI000BB95D83|nr:hypothetical protein [Thermoanaerobacterium sp. RBIITD]SNX52985.1 hypothetical protein SAMN05660242_0463 [Thermoanaerobacterium sp. RBIITD]